MTSGLAQIRKSVLTLALPVTVSSLLQRTEGIAAVFLVGGLGATSIAAVGLGQLLAFMATTLVSGLSVGANVLIAQLWGARRTKDVGEAATHLLGLAAIVSCTLMVLGWSLNHVIMELLGAENAVIALALPYSNFIFLVIPCTIVLQILSSIMQGTGDTKTPMYALIAVNLLYLTIAYPLIYGLWGFPAWGITGAAVATGLAEGTGVVYLLWACRKIFRTSLHVRRDLLRSTWQIGAAVSGERMFQQAGIILYTKIVLIVRHGHLCRASSRLVDRIPIVPAGIWFCHRGSHDGGAEHRRREIRPGQTRKLGGQPPSHHSHGRNGCPLFFLPLHAHACLHQ